MKTKKTFDCIAMKRRGAEIVQTELANMTSEQELAYWQTGTEQLQQRQVFAQEALSAHGESGEIETMPLPGMTAGRRNVPS